MANESYALQTGEEEVDRTLDLNQQKEGQTDDANQKNPMDFRRKLAKEAEEYFIYYKSELSQPYTNMVKWWRLFQNEVTDLRLPHERWRAFVPVPYPFSVVKTLAASSSELFLALDPPIKAMAGDPISRELQADKFTRLFDYIFRKINFRSSVTRLLEEMFIQGVAVRKNTYVEEYKTVMMNVSKDQMTRFEEGVHAVKMGGVEEQPDLSSAENYDAWRNKMQKGGISAPPMPTPGPTKILSYAGPGFADLQIFDLFYNPYIANFHEQPCIIQRSLKPKQWLMERTGHGSDKIYDPEAVSKGMGHAGETDRINEWQSELYQAYGLNSNHLSDPQLKNSVEIWEVWMPSNRESSYRVVLNREIVINKNLDIPYYHGNHPYLFVRNNAVTGQALGMSEFKVTERLFYEQNSFRGLRLDSLLMSVLPVFVKAKDSGLKKMSEQLAPFRVLEVNRPDAVSQLTTSNVDPALFTESNEFKRDIDEASGTGDGARGKTSAPRVSASSVEQAFNSTLVRIKARMYDFENDLSKFIPHSLFLMYQYWPEDKILRIGGEPKINPMAEYKKEEFMDALDADYRFVGATTAINEDIKIQAMQQWFTTLINSQLPEFKANVMAEDITDKVFSMGSSAKYFMTEDEIMQQQQEAQEAEAGAATAEQGGPQEGAPPSQEGPPV